MTDLLADRHADALSRQSVIAARARHATPAAGRAFTTTAASWNSLLLEAERILVPELSILNPDGPLTQPVSVHSTGLTMSPPVRSARRLLASALVGALVGELGSQTGLPDAEEWFRGSASTSRRISPGAEQAAMGYVRELVSREGASEMLPYILDPHPHAYRRNLHRTESGATARTLRKRQGSFFTPIDVAEHIVDLALDGCDLDQPNFTVLDPAAGTGVFLRAAHAGLLRRGVDRQSAIRSLFGIDVDECCAEMCAFVLLHDSLNGDHTAPASPRFEAWMAIRSQQLTADSLHVLDGTQSSVQLFDRRDAPEWTQSQFSVVIGNPPYASLGERADVADLRSRYVSLASATASTDIYVAFLEFLCSQLVAGGAGAMVVPMSISYGTNGAPRLLRKAIDEAGGEWGFEFFDRTPDALFGDDVKQRTSIVTRRVTQSNKISTGPVMRWTSRNRNGLFERVPHIEIGKASIEAGIPKLGSRAQACAFEKLRARDGRFCDDVVTSQRVIPPVSKPTRSKIYIAGTAYNWLSVYRDGRYITNGVAEPSRSGLIEVEFENAEIADVAYSVLVSRLSYWLWRVECDAFHVQAGWLSRIPISLGEFEDGSMERLAKLGRTLWAGIVDHPVVSRNRGRTTLSYCPYREPGLLDEIDSELVSALQLPSDLVQELSHLVRSLVTVGRDSSSEHGLRRALASWNED